MQLHDIFFQIIRYDTTSFAANICSCPVVLKWKSVTGYHIIPCNTAKNTYDLIHAQRCLYLRQNSIDHLR